MSLTLDLLLPLGLLAALAVVVPLGLARMLPRRLPMVLANAGLSALALYVLGAALLAGLYLASAPGLAGRLAGNPAGAALWLARQGLLPVIAWLPVLALTELAIAQRIAGEARP